MDNKNSIEKLEKYQEKIKELFKELVTDEFYDMWADTFEIESVEEKQVMRRISNGSRKASYRIIADEH